MFRHAAAQGVHGSDPNGWASLPVGRRAAYEAFVLVLLCLDGLAAEEERRTRSQNPQIPPAAFVPVEETILRSNGGAADVIPIFTEERRIVITEGTGLAPSAARAPAAAAPPIGPDNTQARRPFLARRATPAAETIPTQQEANDGQAAEPDPADDRAPGGDGAGAGAAAAVDPPDDVSAATPAGAAKTNRRRGRSAS